ncbi:MAG: type II secretion system protein [Dehalococcoidia bacterium]|nr:type II secretion system protein [Dehalococcoidia bacterium]
MIKKLCQNQKGMTLLELLMVIALVGVLSIALGSISYSVIYRTEGNSAHVAAASGIENAASRIARDGQSAQNTNLVPGAAAVSSITLNWMDPITGDFHAVLYFLSGSDLRRRESINSVVQTETTVTKYFTGAGFSQPVNETRLFKVTLTSSGGSPTVNETREYHVTLRAMG